MMLAMDLVAIKTNDFDWLLSLIFDRRGRLFFVLFFPQLRTVCFLTKITRRAKLKKNKHNKPYHVSEMLVICMLCFTVVHPAGTWENS